MKLVYRAVVLTALTLNVSGGLTFAQDHRDDHRQSQNGNDNRGPNGYENRGQNGHDNRGQNGHDNRQYVRHDDWRKGRRMDRNDWNRGERVDYRTYHLNAPRRGYEWRQVDGNYVLAAVATGLIASVIAASAAR